MDLPNIYRCSTPKPMGRFIEDMGIAAKSFGYSVHFEQYSDIASFYRSQNANVPDSFNLKVVQLCRPGMSGPSLALNPERILFIRKRIYVYQVEGTTHAFFLEQGKAFISEVLGHHTFGENQLSDDEFAARLANSFEAVKTIIEKAMKMDKEVSDA